MTKIDDLKVKMFADGADLESIKELSKKSYIQGFTTNPSLMKKGGIVDYKKFVIDMLNIVKDKPVSFEVFSDEINEMENQAREIASWGKNIYVKIPVVNTKGKFAGKAISVLSSRGIKLNITAVYSSKQTKRILKEIDNKTKVIISCTKWQIHHQQ